MTKEGFKATTINGSAFLRCLQVLRARLNELGFPPNVLRILKGHGITTLKTLCDHTRQELLAIRFLGTANVDTIERLLKTMDLTLKQT